MSEPLKLAHPATFAYHSLNFTVWIGANIYSMKLANKVVTKNLKKLGSRVHLGPLNRKYTIYCKILLVKNE
jgi:hypothetical protein